MSSSPSWSCSSDPRTATPGAAEPRVQPAAMRGERARPGATSLVVLTLIRAFESASLWQAVWAAWNWDVLGSMPFREIPIE